MFVRDGTVCVARFGPGEAAVLNEVILEVITLLSEGFDRADPVVERLFPDIYPDDPTISAELRRYTEDDLRSAKLEQAAMLLDALPVEASRGPGGCARSGPVRLRRTGPDQAPASRASSGAGAAGKDI